MVALTGINLVPISLPSGRGWPAATLTSINFADQIHALNIRRFGRLPGTRRLLLHRPRHFLLEPFAED
jgi:hypothetical protein